VRTLQENGVAAAERVPLSDAAGIGGRGCAMVGKCLFLSLCHRPLHIKYDVETPQTAEAKEQKFIADRGLIDQSKLNQSNQKGL
jgi:hypothetical protein